MGLKRSNADSIYGHLLGELTACTCEINLGKHCSCRANPILSSPVGGGRVRRWQLGLAPSRCNVEDDTVSRWALLNF